MVSRAIAINVPEGKIAAGLTALQERYAKLEIGSYPYFRQGLAGTTIVLRGFERAQIDAAAEEHDSLAGGGEEERHRCGGVEVELLEREDAVAKRAVDRDEHGEHEAGDEEGRPVDKECRVGKPQPAHASRHGGLVTPRGHAALCPPYFRHPLRSLADIAAFKMPSSEMASPASTAAIEPLRITATRSATWTSSGRSLE